MDGRPVYNSRISWPDTNNGMFVRGTLPRKKVESDIELILPKPFFSLLPNYGY